MVTVHSNTKESQVYSIVEPYWVIRSNYQSVTCMHGLMSTQPGLKESSIQDIKSTEKKLYVLF